MRHIGILAHSADGAALCFLEMVRESARRLGPHRHPEITLSILPMEGALEAYERNDLAVVRRYLARTAGAWPTPDATSSSAPTTPRTSRSSCRASPCRCRACTSPRSWLDTPQSCGYRQVGLLGTKWTMEGTVYPAAFGRHDIGQRIPTPEDRALVDRVIFGELTQGRLEDRSRAEFIRIIAGLRAVGCDAVALSCTEIPLLITPEVSPLPTLDSTRLLAREAVAYAIADSTPEWRGGAVGHDARL